VDGLVALASAKAVRVEVLDPVRLYGSKRRLGRKSNMPVNLVVW